MMDRRKFLKAGAATAAATAALASVSSSLEAAGDLPTRGGVDYSPDTGIKRTAVPSACWQCVTRCASIGFVEDGRLIKIESNPNSIRTEGVMCSKGQGSATMVYDPDRILHPMRRVGKRGEGLWKRISWDEALDELAGRMKKLKDAGTPELFAYHYGRAKASSSAIIEGFVKAYGSGSIYNHTSICEGGKWVAQELTWGGHFDNWDFDNTNYVLNFGSNVLETHTNHIPTAHRLLWAMADRGVKMVTFDVRLSNTAAKSNEWVPIKPGTDLAVILAMCNVVVNEGLYTGEGEEFLKYTKLTPNIDDSVADKIAAVKAHVKDYTPEWAEGLSGVSAAKITEIAREFANAKPACLVSYRGAIAHYNGNEAERACQLLAALTGNIDNPGGRMKAVGAGWSTPKLADGSKTRKLPLGDGFPGQVAFPTHHVSHQVLKMIKDGSWGRPEIYLWYCYTPAYANGDTQENIDILKDEKLLPFTVAVDPFYGDSAHYADMILPDATFLERWDYEDMVDPSQIGEYYIRQPMVTPLGESRDFGDVVCDLAQRIGFDLGVRSKYDFVKQSINMTPGVKEAGGFDYMVKNGVWHDPNAKPKAYIYKVPIPASVYNAENVILDKETGVYWNWKKAGHNSADEAHAKGYTWTKGGQGAYVAQKMAGGVFSGFAPDHGINKSGALELYSILMEKAGFNPMPSWMDIPTHQNMKPDELHLTTFKWATHTHSRTMNLKYNAELYHANPAWINPVTAAERGINDGGKIRIKSASGEFVTKAHVTNAITPGVVAVSHHCGHWAYGRYASDRRAPDSVGDADYGRKWWSDNGVHPNWAIPNVPDPINGQQAWMDTVVTVTPA